MKKIVRNVFALGCLITLMYLLYVVYMIYSNTDIYERIQGCWVNVESNRAYTFTGNEYVSDIESGTYSIRGNKLRLNTGTEHLIHVTRDYIVLDGVYYLRK